MKLQTHLPDSKITQVGHTAGWTYSGDWGAWHGVIMVEPPKIVVDKPISNRLLAFLKRLRYAA